jgi:hypothetical protein
MATKLETIHAGDFEIWAPNHDYSHDIVPLNSGTAGVRVGTLAAISSANNEAVNYVPGGANATGTIVGIFWDTYTNPPAIGTAPQDVVIVARDSVVNRSKLDWNGMTAAQITTAIASLKALGVIVRDGI